MKIVKLRHLLSLVSLFSILLAVSNTAFAAPVRFEQVQQIINVRPGRANTGGFTQLRLADDGIMNSDGDDDDKTSQPPAQDDRVITTTTTTIEEDVACDCPVEKVRGGFPKWAFLGLAAIPLLFLTGRDRSRTPTPTPTETPTTTPTETPTMTPTVTPTPEPVPEPMTILLFGTGLAGIGIVARRRLRKRGADNAGDDEDEQKGE